MTEYGPHCLARVTPGLPELIDTTIRMTWASLPDFVRDVPRPGVVAIASERAWTSTRTSSAGTSIVVFDQGLQAFFASITHHVVGRSAPALIRILLEKSFAARLYLDGKLMEAAAVGLLANAGIDEHRGGPELGDGDQRLCSRLTRAQTIFTVAHEAWHVLMRSTAAAPMVRDVFQLEMMGFMDGSLASRAGGVDIDSTLEHIENRLLSLTGRSDAARELQLRFAHIEQAIQTPEEWMLREEFICDLYGSLATLQTLTSLGVSQRVAISGCVSALLSLAVFAYLTAEAQGNASHARDRLSEAIVRVQVLTIMLLSRVCEGAIERGRDSGDAVRAVAENVRVATDGYSRIVVALTHVGWQDLVPMLLADPGVKHDAGQLAADRAHLSGLVGFAYPGYR